MTTDPRYEHHWHNACPVCGGRKRTTSIRCASCTNKLNRAERSQAGRSKYCLGGYEQPDAHEGVCHIEEFHRHCAHCGYALLAVSPELEPLPPENPDAKLCESCRLSSERQALRRAGKGIIAARHHSQPAYSAAGLRRPKTLVEGSGKAALSDGMHPGHAGDATMNEMHKESMRMAAARGLENSAKRDRKGKTEAA